MFIGSIGPRSRLVVQDVLKKWGPRPLYVGCCGNLTIERIAYELGYREIFSNDVSLYSVYLGRMMAGVPIEVSIKAEEWEWLETYLEDPPGVMAVIQLLSSMALQAGGDNPHAARLREGYIDQFPVLWEKTRERIAKATETKIVTGFFAEDVIQFVDKVPKKAAFISYPPTYKGGYERMYRLVDRVFEWEEPTYSEFGHDELALLVKKVAKLDKWALSWRERIDALPLVARVKDSVKAVPFHLHSDIETAYFLAPRMKAEAPNVPRLGEVEEIAGPLEIRRLPAEQFEALRAEYMDPSIEAGPVDQCFAAICGGKLIGAFATPWARTGYGRWDSMMLQSDFAINPTSYKRLSKLVVAATLSVEVKNELERVRRERVNVMRTAVFSDNAVSMKYRGLYAQTKRKDARHSIYEGPAGKWTLEQAFEWWMKLHSKARRTPA